MQPVTTTMTATAQSPAEIRNYFANRAHALLDIVDRFNPAEEEEQKGRFSARAPQGRGDILSAHLTAWSRAFLSGMMRQTCLNSVERVRELVQPYFNRLDEILRDPLLSAAPNSHPVTLRQPVVDGEIWEEEVHARCYVLFRGISPIDGKPMLESPPAHEFARAMMSWRVTLFPEAASTDTAPSSDIGAVVIRMPTERNEAVERAGFRSLGFLLKMRRMRESLGGHLQLVDERQEENRLVLAQAQQRADLHEAHLAEELEKLQQSQKQHLEQLNGQIETQEARYRMSIEGLERNIESAERSNQATAKLLSDQLTRLREEQQRTREALEAEVHAVKQQQEQKVSELKAQQALIESQHQLQVTQMQNTHSQTVSYLERNNSTLSERVHQTQNGLNRANHINQQQAQEVQNLKIETQRLRGQVAAEKRRADEADDGGGCILL